LYNFFHIKLWCREEKYKRAFLQHKINSVIPKGSGKITATSRKFFCGTVFLIVVINDAVICQHYIASLIHERTSMENLRHNNDRKTKVLRESPFLVSLCPPQIPQGLVWN